MENMNENYNMDEVLDLSLENNSEIHNVQLDENLSLEFLKDNGFSDDDIKKIQELGFYNNGKIDEVFSNAYKVYSQFLLIYIDRAIFLSGYDVEIRKSDLHIKYKKENLDFFESNSYLKYFSLMNVLHIENLDKKQIELLNQMYLEGDYKYNSDAIKFIKSTYLEVLNSDKLILGINYDLELDHKNELDWEENNNQKQEFIDTTINRLYSNSSKYFPMSIEVIKQYTTSKVNSI